MKMTHCYRNVLRK